MLKQVNQIEKNLSGNNMVGMLNKILKNTNQSNNKGTNNDDLDDEAGSSDLENSDADSQIDNMILSNQAMRRKTTFDSKDVEHLRIKARIQQQLVVDKWQQAHYSDQPKRPLRFRKNKYLEKQCCRHRESSID